MDLNTVPDSSLLGVTQTNNPLPHELPPIRPETIKRRMAHRKLRPIHISMITINAVLGTGLYWRGGQVLELGGSLAVVLSFLILGILAWAVMQCIAELLCIWPVPGALAVFVRKFVDDELGIVVGIAYWFTYSVAFAYLISAAAAEVQYWTTTTELDVVVLYILVPLILILINSFGVELYGWFEVATATAKISCLVIITIFMIKFAPGDANYFKNDSSTNPTHVGIWDNPTHYDDSAANNWVTAFFMCLSIATFAYIGVEAPAAIALEAEPPKTKSTEEDRSRQLNDTGNIGDTVRFSAKWISVFACVVYTLCGILLSLSVDATNEDLPRLDWIHNAHTTKVMSAFVIAANLANDYKVGGAFNGFLVFTAVLCANTNLFIASRMLFGLTNQIEGGPDEHWYLNILAWLGRTNSYRVPIRAMAVSALAFIWVPFLQLAQPDKQQSGETTSGIKSFIDILADMGSVGVLIVWACECWAFLRYYDCINRHKNELVERRVPRVRRFDEGDDNDYPYISNGQPFTAYFGLIACLFILLVVNGASLWNGFHTQAFLSSYLIVIIFILLWILLKLFRGARWSLVDLSDPDTVESMIRGLHQFSFAGYSNEPTSETGWSSSMWPLSLLARSPRETS
ncbi:amino acid/polyamine transporter I [Jackrogersella minutella]|nr:amino acid/polyamine transporter I [Jackrogersella minutella]